MAAERRTHRDLGDACPLRPADVDEHRPGAVLRADRGERLGPVHHDPGDRGERLDVVDDGRQAAEALRRRMRWPLLRLAALALEGLEQDRLLPEQVRALDGREGDVEVAARSRRRRRR